MSKYYLLQQEMVALPKKKDSSRTTMPPTDFHGLEKFLSSKPARIDLGLPPANRPREQTRESRRGESSKKVAAVIEPKRERGLRLEKRRFAQRP